MIRRISPFAAIALIACAVTLVLPAAASATAAFAKTTGLAVTGATTATLFGTINPENESTTYALQWDVGSSAWCSSGGTSGSPANTTPETALDPSWFPSYVNIELTGLTYETSYCAQFVATNADGEGYGGQMTWVQSLPEVDTSAAYSTSALGGVVEGEINPHGAPTDYQAEYAAADSDWCITGGSSGTPSTNLDFYDLGFTDDTFHHVSVKLFQLTPGETYCARLVAYSAGKGEGQLVTFTVNMPGAFTGTASSTGGSTATVTGEVNPDDQATSYDVEYDQADSAWCTSGGTSGSPANETDPIQLGLTDANFHNVSVDLAGLTPAIDYCARLVATNAYGEVDGSQTTWTQGSTPAAYTVDTYSTGATTATVEGIVNPHAEDTTYAAQYDVATSGWCTSGGTSGSPAHTTDGTDPIPSDDFVSVDLTGLTEGTDYCAQLVAMDANGQAEGGQVTWTQGLPTAETFDAYATGDTTATVDGDVNPAGKATTWQVQYDLASSGWCTSGGASGSAANATAATPLAAGGDFQSVSLNLTGLSSGTGYCGEVVATNADGTSEGGQLFWTQTTPPLAQAELAVTLTGSGAGRVTSSPVGIDCGSGHTSCSYSFPPGTLVTLTATAAVGSAFPGWTTPGCAGTGPCVIVMNVSHFVQVGFVSLIPPTSTVAVQRAGSGSGTVTSFPSGIDCGVTCSYAFDVRREVQLTAVAAPGSTFTGWSGGGCSGTETCTLTKAAGQTVTATFTKNPPLDCKVPKVNGKKPATAKAAIRRAHCGVGKITKAFSTKVKKGRVISTKPRAGSRHPRGTKVKLTVSKGRKP